MADYHINVFWSDEDGCYVADIPDLAFCSALGDTPEEALRQVRQSKPAWLESSSERGNPIPEPRYRPAHAARRGLAVSRGGTAANQRSPSRTSTRTNRRP